MNHFLKKTWSLVEIRTILERQQHSEKPQPQLHHGFSCWEINFRQMKQPMSIPSLGVNRYEATTIDFFHSKISVKIFIFHYIVSMNGKREQTNRDELSIDVLALMHQYYRTD